MALAGVLAIRPLVPVLFARRGKIIFVLTLAKNLRV